MTTEVTRPKTLKEQGKKLAHSNWLFTFNTNCQWNGDDNDKQRKLFLGLAEGMKKAFSQQNIASAITLKSAQKKAGHEVNANWIASIRVTPPKVEVGGDRAQIHGHVGVFIDHYTRIQLDYTKLKHVVRDEVRAATGEPKRRIYFNAKVLKSDAQITSTIINYVDKDTAETEKITGIKQ